MNPEQETPQAPQQPPVVHISRPIEPAQPVISAERQKKHDRSVRFFPQLNLSEGEFIISAVRRHPIGLIVPLAIGTFVIAVALSLLVGYEQFVETLSIQGALADASTMTLPILIFVALIAFYMFVAYYVYSHNKFYLTNESIIQEIQLTLFSRSEQTISLGNIEDASFTQTSILQQIFNYGDIRLSTQGDENTYRFSYVASPKDRLAQLNNAVEAFKNGRPVSED